jgi:hypothetical protein
MALFHYNNYLLLLKIMLYLFVLLPKLNLCNNMGHLNLIYQFKLSNFHVYRMTGTMWSWFEKWQPNLTLMFEEWTKTCLLEYLALYI